MKSRNASSQNQTIIIAVVAIIIIAATAYYFMGQGPKPSPTPDENKPPIVVAKTTKPFAIVGDEVAFSAEGSRDPDGEIASYNWNLGDEETTEGETVTHSYELPGDYIVTVTVVDDDGEGSSNDVSPIHRLRI